MKRPGPDGAIACPHCGRINDVHAHTEGHEVPGEGDVAVCWGCRGFAVFVAGPFGLAQRAATEAESAEFLADPSVRRAMAALASAQVPQHALAETRGENRELVAETVAALRAGPGLERLECGCEFGIVEETEAFVLRPCSPGCPTVAYAKAESARQVKPLVYGYDGEPN